MGFFSRFRKKQEDENPNRWFEVREAHYSKFLGPIDEKIAHSTDVQEVHIDIYTFPPTDKRWYWTLITGGMSDKHQNIPEDATDISGRTELIMYVEEPKGWIYNVLKTLAEMPFKEKTFFYWYHTVLYGEPMMPEPSELTSVFFLPPCFEKPKFDTLQIAGEKVNILWVVPITEREREYVIQEGNAALIDVFQKAEMDPMIDEKRKSLI